MVETTSSSALSTDTISQIHRFFKNVGISANLPESSTKPNAFSNLLGGFIEVNHIESGRVTCTLTVKPPLSNVYGTLHGGAVASVAELMSVACVKTVVEKDLFLGELGISYISAAFINGELEVDGLIVRHGRNVTVTTVEFRIKETKKLVYTARATFYNVPIANL